MRAGTATGPKRYATASPISPRQPISQTVTADLGDGRTLHWRRFSSGSRWKMFDNPVDNGEVHTLEFQVIECFMDCDDGSNRNTPALL